MKHVPLIPRPVSWLSAGLLYLFLGLFMSFVAHLAPRLYELFETEPRLAALGFLGLWTSPIVFVGVFHALVHGVLDRADRGGASGNSSKNGPSKGRFVSSLWAGVFSWCAIMFTSSVVVIIVLVIFPPPPADRVLSLFTSLFAWPFDDRARAGIHTLAWVVVAAQLYDLERAVRQRAKRGEE